MGQKVSPIGLRLGITHKHQSQWFVDPRNGSMKKSYPSLILEDRFIRERITPKFPRASIAQILIFRTLDYIRVEIHTAPTQNLNFSLPTRERNQEIFVSESNNNKTLQNPPENKSENSAVYRNNLNGFNLKALQQELELELSNYKKKTLSLFFPVVQKDRNQENLLENASIQSNVNLGILIKQLNKPYQYASLFAKYLSTQLENRKYTVKQAFNRSLRLIQTYKMHGIKIKVSGRLNGTDIAEQKSFFKGRIPLSSLDANIDYYYETAKTLYGILGVKVWIWREEN
nr:ribosomal protein S3 [Trentepohlia sp. YN1317]